MSAVILLWPCSPFRPPQGKAVVLFERRVPKLRRIFGEMLSLARGDFEQQISFRYLPSSVNICYNCYIVHYHMTILKELDLEEHWEADEAVTTPLFKRLSNTKIYKVTKNFNTIYKNWKVNKCTSIQHSDCSGNRKIF
jgi:hypothetical protein